MEGQTLRIVATCIEQDQDAQCSLQSLCHGFTESPFTWAELLNHFAS